MKKANECSPSRRQGSRRDVYFPFALSVFNHMYLGSRFVQVPGLIQRFNRFVLI
jgi:hypothetical protein